VSAAVENCPVAASRNFRQAATECAATRDITRESWAQTADYRVTVDELSGSVLAPTLGHSGTITAVARCAGGTRLHLHAVVVAARGVT
jgi:hypothetical protein